MWAMLACNLLLDFLWMGQWQEPHEFYEIALSL
jgi:hypothetical protein